MQADIGWPLIASVVAAVVVLGVAAALRARRRRAVGHRLQEPDIPLVFPVTVANDPGTVSSPANSGMNVSPDAYSQDFRFSADQSRASAPGAPSWWPPRGPPAPPHDAGEPFAPDGGTPPRGLPLDLADESQLFAGKTIRFYRPKPQSNTVKLLPGRLVVISGEDLHEEIRFVGVPGAPPEVTLGRSDGPPLRHIQFRARTVSRLHARMVLSGDGWTITNLSGTNPVIVNGTELTSENPHHRLSDGDQIEMGEVIFRFHAR